MSILKTSASLLITLLLLYSLNRSWSTIPPLGKFLDPFHGFWQNSETSDLRDRSFSIPGLQDEVTVIYDSLRIPHIFAKSDEDLYLAQGFIHAADRLWQMEIQTHAGAGRVSEILGERLLDYDRKQRRIGMVYGAQSAMSQMGSEPATKMAVENYSAGVNAYISSLSYEDYPLEYKLLDYAPEEWTPLKCAILAKYMCQTLSISEKDLEMTNALKLFGKEMVDLLYPDREPVSDPVVDNPGKWNFQPVKIDSVSREKLTAEALRRGEMRKALTTSSVSLRLRGENLTIDEVDLTTVGRRLLEKPPPEVGSNNWAVSGSKTATGSPMLCNDPHLTLNLPSIWYAIHLNSPTVNTMGASLPGAPAVIIGFNDSIAWGETNAQRDVVDWYKIQFKDKSKNEYLSDGTWKPSRKVIEKFEVKGSATFYDTVTYTHHGPVVFDESYHPEDESAHYAFRWTAHDPSDELITFHKLNRAKNFDDYMEALDQLVGPPQNFAFASVSGDIAMRIQGKYPVRRKDEGKFVLDGSKTSDEWKAFIPSEQNVMYKNPERGFVSSANQYPADSTYPYYVTANSFEAYRNRRINSVLRDSKNITVKDLMNLQNDNYSIKAAESVPLFLSHLDTTTFSDNEKKAYAILKTWDYFNAAEATAPSYYETWLNELRDLIWDEFDSAHVALQFPTAFTTIDLIKRQPGMAFFDLAATPEKETAVEILRMSFSKCVETVERWKADRQADPSWGMFKDGYIGHQLRQESLGQRISYGGNRESVNAHTRTHGPSWRMVVSLEKSGVKAWGVYPGGQSGNPGSPYYKNMIEPWAEARYFELKFVNAPEGLSATQVSKTVLSPSK